MGLKVITKSGDNLSIEKVLIRNISKIHGLLLILDFIGGLVLFPDLNQKYSDKIADTTVIPAERTSVWKV